MTAYPNAIDDDTTIIRIDDNLSELGGMSINQLREAVFAIEKNLGVNPAGSLSSLVGRLSVSINDDGTIKTEALQAIGLVTLPIHDNQVGSNAGIKESKLDLDYSTADLNTKLTALEALFGTLSVLVQTTSNDLLIHISGGQKLSDNSTSARHVASHIDINAVPVDPRDTYVWEGLIDKDGDLRPATQVAEALLEINNDLVEHQNANADAHPATAITVETKDFTEFPLDIENVQDALNFIDGQETVSQGIDRAVMHANGIPKTARTETLNADGRGLNVIPLTPIEAYLAEPNQSAPNDNINNGDDIVKFLPTDNSDFSFDAKFTNVKVGDVIRIDYGNGISGEFPIKSIRFVPGSEWVVRISTYNLVSARGLDGYDGYASIDQSRFDSKTWGVYATAGVVPNTFPGGSDGSTNSIIVANPRGAAVTGLGFDPAQIDENHYLLYLRLYVNGDPTSASFDLPPIDVSGNAGTTPGKYNIDRVVEETNKEFQKAGYNFRFISFNQKGEFGLMLSDHYGGVAFSIISGKVNGAVLEVGTFINNVIGDGANDGYDALGLGGLKAGFASPDAGSYDSGQSASSYPTLVHSPVRGRNSYVNGRRSDLLAGSDHTSGPEGDGYWNAYITDVITSIIDNTKTVQYTIDLDLRDQELKKGKTIVVQPGDFDSTATNGYGRFIIGDVSYIEGCDGYCQTNIMVINGAHGTADPLANIPGVGTDVRMYFSEDSVSINIDNIVQSGIEFHRYHEVFVTRLGETFAQERARMVKQSSSGTLLGTDSSGWRIRNVSPKLAGYRSGSSFRQYVRFVISDYNSVTGEYDGYIAEADGAGVANAGPITRGRKDHPIRYYDNSNVSFVDIEFREDALSPGSILMPDSISRYVDIEVFPTLRTNDEFFAISGVSHDEATFRSITDLREFGNLSEENFTDSAVKFVQAGERYLHANGVVRGFAYEGVSSTSDAMLEFTGGIALTNGAFVAIDSYTVKLPEIKTSSSDNVDFFICVTEGGQLQAVIRNNGSQFYEVDDSYWVPTLSFREIVDARKDLTIIAKVNATIADQDGGATVYSLNSVTDARRFVYNEDINDWTLSIAPEEDGYKTTFRSAEAVQCWVNEYNVTNVRVVHLEVNSLVNLSGMTNNVRLHGGTAIVTSGAGLMIGNNVHLDGIQFTYSPSQAVVANDNLHLNTNFGCVYSESYYNMKVTNCKFTSTVECPPAIHFKPSTGNNIVNIDVSKNEFNLSGNTRNCAIAFTKRGTVSTELSLNSVFIEGNTCRGSQAIVITVDANVFNGSAISSDPFVTNNVCIKNNKCGAIGFLTSESGQVHSALQISENDAVIIGTLDGGGNQINIDDFNLPDESGSITIDKNKCYSIGMTIDNSSASSYISITNNNIVCSSSAFPSGYNNTYGRTGIYVCSPYTGIATTSQISNVKIIGNSVYNIPELGYLYDTGIELHKAGIVSNNSVGALASSGVGIRLVGVETTEEDDSRREISVQNNSINRGGTTISAYIDIDHATDDPTFYKIVDNYFDSESTGSSTTTITGTGSGTNHITRNINHIQSIRIKYLNAFKVRDPGESQAGQEYYKAIPSANTEAIQYIKSNQDGDNVLINVLTGHSNHANVCGIIPFNQFLPPGTVVLSIATSWSAQDANWDSGIIRMQLRSSSFSGDVPPEDSDNLDEISGYLEVDGFVDYSSGYAKITVEDADPNTSAKSVTIGGYATPMATALPGLLVTYKWY